MLSRFPSLALLVIATACSSGGGTTGTGQWPPPCATTFVNPIAPGADPWVVRHDGRYYAVESRDGGIWVYRTDTLTSLKRQGVRVWSPPSTGWNQTDIWAPELHHIDGRWYIYYAAGQPGPSGPDAAFTDQRSGVLESVTDDPQGGWVDRGMLYTGDDVATGANPVWAIDLSVARIDGQLYAVWSGWEANQPTHVTPQHLYIARMSNPWTIATNRVKISSPVESWEVGTQLDLQEGPEFLLPGGHTFIVYSTRESFLPDYRLGVLRLAAPGADPMDPASWVKSGPAFVGAPQLGVYGVGHASFTTSPDGTEHWIVYHAKTRNAPGWDDRVIRMQRFTLNADSSPSFGTPVPGNTPIPVPSGQCTR
ncbi:MAG TPA: glycoside hydrolase family 43 protein [Gemmatimonadaceae bacterium]|nr:glycoside hydrolase family 43 protein [Gemmatimonadaceae bacterium]